MNSHESTYLPSNLTVPLETRMVWEVSESERTYEDYLYTALYVRRHAPIQEKYNMAKKVFYCIINENSGVLSIFAVRNLCEHLMCCITGSLCDCDAIEWCKRVFRD